MSQPDINPSYKWWPSSPVVQMALTSCHLSAIHSGCCSGPFAQMRVITSPINLHFCPCFQAPEFPDWATARLAGLWVTGQEPPTNYWKIKIKTSSWEETTENNSHGENRQAWFSVMLKGFNRPLGLSSHPFEKKCRSETIEKNINSGRASGSHS